MAVGILGNVPGLWLRKWRKGVNVQHGQGQPASPGWELASPHPMPTRAGSGLGYRGGD